MAKYKLLSHSIDVSTPMYGDIDHVKIRARKSIMSGAPCNTFILEIQNHTGTHIDAPAHFYKNGKKISEYRIDQLMFRSPYILKCRKSEGQLVEKKDLRGLKKCDILIIKTGFGRKRGSKKYIFENPGISAEAALFIRQKYPMIKAVGIDCISISSYLKREEGRNAHRIFLKGSGFKGGPVLLIEDMDLSGDLSGIKRVFVAPLMVRGIDSSPCAVIGEYE